MDKQLKAFGNVPFNHGALLSLLGNYRRPNDKIARLIADGDLVSLKKGLYILGAEHRPAPVSLPLVANLLYGPSHVSLDFALSWHGLIPEGVFEVSSVTPRRAREYNTPLGRFTYIHTSQPLYGTGITMARNPDGSAFLIASPTKALCDKIMFTRNLQVTSARAMQAYLEEDLRIDPAALAELELQIVQQCRAYGYKARHLDALANVLQALACR